MQRLESVLSDAHDRLFPGKDSSWRQAFEPEVVADRLSEDLRPSLQRRIGSAPCAPFEDRVLILMALGDTRENRNTAAGMADKLRKCQNRDGGWGEGSPALTAWVLLGLLTAGEVHDSAIQRGVHYLLQTRAGKGFWNEPPPLGEESSEGSDLRYHGHRGYFPLWALGMYRRRLAGETRIGETIRQATLASLLSPEKRNGSRPENAGGQRNQERS